MAEYADITSFYEWLDWLEKESNTSYPEYQTLMFYEIRDKLDDLPRVVRCKDCKHYEDHKRRIYENCMRDRRQFPMKPDDFCSYGERREENAAD